MQNIKMKGLITIVIVGVIYGILKLYVVSTPNPDDDKLPDQFLKSVVVFAVSGTQDNFS